MLMGARLKSLPSIAISLNSLHTLSLAALKQDQKGWGPWMTAKIFCTSEHTWFGCPKRSFWAPVVQWFLVTDLNYLCCSWDAKMTSKWEKHQDQALNGIGYEMYDRACGIGMLILTIWDGWLEWFCCFCASSQHVLYNASWALALQSFKFQEGACSADSLDGGIYRNIWWYWLARSEKGFFLS